MPVYEYRCDACNIQFDLRQKFSDPPVDICPKCGGTVRKLVSTVSFSLKGGGWYGDGYGAKAEPTKSEGDAVAGAEAGTPETVVKTESASTDKVPTTAGTAAIPVTQTPATTQAETKSKAGETPTTSDKAVVKSQVV